MDLQYTTHNMYAIMEEEKRKFNEAIGMHLHCYII